MNNNQNTGNQNEEYTLNKIYAAMKQNIFRDLNTAEVVQVISIDDTNSKYLCSLMSNPNLKFECTKLQDLTVEQSDIMLCIFTSTDFRANLIKYKNNQVVNTMQVNELHSKNYGILIGLVYRQSNGGE